MCSQVFISHDSSEYAQAKKIKNALVDHGLSVWLAPDSIPAGSDYANEIPEAIMNCSVFLLLLSEISQVSIWVPKELDLAIKYKKRIIPFHIDNGCINAKFDFRLTNIQIQRLEKNEAFNDALEKIVRSITSAIAEDKEISPANTTCNDSDNAKHLSQNTPHRTVKKLFLQSFLLDHIIMTSMVFGGLLIIISTVILCLS